MSVSSVMNARWRFLAPLSMVALLAISTMPLPAQDFGFGLDDQDGIGSGSALTVSTGGEGSALITGYFSDFADGADHTQLGDVFSGKLNFSAESARADVVINLELQPSLPQLVIDEAYVRVYFGALDIEGGLRKLSWGKADSNGPLDIINPLDYSDLSTMSDTQDMKIARPLVHASFRFGQFSKLEGVFIPSFEPIHFAESGRWASDQFASLSQLPSENIIRPDTTTLDYAQAGLRFTTTIGSADIGAQYYYGRLSTPAIIVGTPTGLPPLPTITFSYNPYHQIGIDWAQVIAGFNSRAEFAANITEDLDGDDGAVYNPSLAWSFGFDKNLFWDINLNLQVNESIILMYDDVDSSAPSTDIEADSDITTTSVTAVLSRKFLRDELELKTAVMGEIESRAFLVVPALSWTRDSAALELSAGIFAGSEEGMFGMFHDNSFIRAGVTYTF